MKPPLSSSLCDGSGSPPSTLPDHESKWVWFKSLQFLRDQMNSRVIGGVGGNSQNGVGESYFHGSLMDETQIEPEIDIVEGDGEAQLMDDDDIDDVGDSRQSLLMTSEEILEQQQQQQHHHHCGLPPLRKRAKMNGLRKKFMRTSCNRTMDNMLDSSSMVHHHHYHCQKRRQQQHMINVEKKRYENNANNQQRRMMRLGAAGATAYCHHYHHHQDEDDDDCDGDDDDEPDDDETYHFLMSVRSPLRSLPLDRQMYVRLKIQEIILNELNAERAQHSNAGPAATTVERNDDENRGNSSRAAGNNDTPVVENCCSPVDSERDNINLGRE